jgi:DNA-binding beta-propeller fold protein YncE
MKFQNSTIYNAGETTELGGIAVDTSYIYVADLTYGRILKFTNDGKAVAKWGFNGRGEGQFNYPHGIAVDSTGNIYVADTDNHRIQKFSNDGKFIAKWGRRGSKDGEFSFPKGIAVDTSGSVYVSDAGNHRIQVFKAVSEAETATDV